MNTEQLKTAEDIAKKYTGEFPDVEGRKISKTWAELRSMMENDILDFASQESKRAVDEFKEKLENELLNARLWVDVEVNKSYIEHVLRFIKKL